MIKIFLLGILTLTFPLKTTAQNISPQQNTFILAKAVKLGRGKAYSIVSTTELNLSKINLDKSCCQQCADCNKKTGQCLACNQDYYLNNGQCVSCPQNASCNNGISFICQDNYYKVHETCAAICNQVVCQTGYKTSSQTNGCCCVP